jgi:hypothetical protein
MQDNPGYIQGFFIKSPQSCGKIQRQTLWKISGKRKFTLKNRLEIEITVSLKQAGHRPCILKIK